MSQPMVVVIQHVAVEGLGLLGALLSARNIGARVFAPGVSLPREALRDAGGLIVLGGPMGVYEADRHPRLHDELVLLEQAVARHQPVLGICLGAQLLAAALGAKVYPGPQKELGWFDVTLSPDARADAIFRSAPPRFKALHWHGDVFDLPRGSTHLASSERTMHQAFAYGTQAWGLLFHLEAEPPQVEAMASEFRDELVAASVSPEALLEDTHAFHSSAAAVGRAVFGGWLSLVESRDAGRTEA